MDRNLIVIDNFLDDPDKIRHCALSLDFDRVQKDVPGLRSCRIAGDIQTEVEGKLKSALGCKEIEVKWDLLPEMKLKTIENLKINNKVAMIGDGINDVPALASSDLGIAVGSGTQIAKANADVVLMGDQLNGLPYALNLAKKTIRKIKQNLTWAFGYNLLAIPLAAGILFPKYGILLTPSIAALLMAISSITVVINALSLD